MTKLGISVMILAVCMASMCLRGVNGAGAGAGSGEQKADDAKLDKLLDRRAEVELSLIRKRAEVIREDPEAQRIQEKIVELYAKLHKTLGKNEKISELREKLSELEKQIEEKRLDDDANPTEREQAEERPDN